MRYLAWKFDVRYALVALSLLVVRVDNPRPPGEEFMFFTGGSPH